VVLKRGAEVPKNKRNGPVGNRTDFKENGKEFSTMKKLVVTLLAALSLMVPMLGSPVKALAVTPTVDFDLTFNSKYVWRGMLLVDDWVAQPSVNVGVGSFTFNVWGNYELTDETEHDKKFTEIDLTLDYTFTIGDFSIPVGLIHYAFPNTEFNATTEVYAGVSYDWIVSPSVTIYQDLDQAAGGSYINLAASYSYAVPGLPKDMSMSVDLGAGISYATSDYNTFYFGVDESAWTDWSASLGVPIGFKGGMFTVTPAVTYTALVDSKIKDTTEDDSNTFFGVSLTMSF
jgi:hypothetical protein